jgi:hypothetical protein
MSSSPGVKYETITVHGEGAALFAQLVSTPAAQGRLGAAIKRGFQTRAAELDLARLLGDLPDH